MSAEPLEPIADAVAYLRAQIDPHDRLNPKFAPLHAAIDALVKAQADILARQAPTLVLKHAKISSEGDRTDFLLMRYAQRNPSVCSSNAATSENILFEGRRQI